jgi:phospholipid/cholesterol/gamma-HCH transport system substrate-binding protein
VTGASNDLTGFITKNKNTLLRLPADSRASLDTLAKYAPTLPCLTDALLRFKPVVEKALGAGTGEPGLPVTVTVKPGAGKKYVPGRDRPGAYGTGTPRCPGGGGAGGATAPASADSDLAGFATPNSVTENALVNELLSLSTGESPEDMPDWSSLLVGPLYRGTAVTLK